MLSIRYRNKKTRRVYILLSDQIHDAETKKIKYVLYQSETFPSLLFVRKIKEFYNKFEEIPKEVSCKIQHELNQDKDDICNICDKPFNPNF